MKKAVPLVVVLAAIAAALFIYFKRSKGTMDLAPGFAAGLAPAETVLFIEVPDVARMEERWAKTSLYKIAQEPEWKEFTAGWDNFVAQNPAAAGVFGVFGEVKKADPAGLFVAFTDIDANGPKLVGGFPYRGRKGDVENVVKKLREQIVQAYPAATSEVANYEGVQVETLKDPKFTAAMAYMDNWFFFATETDLLLKTLSRYKQNGQQAALSKDPLFETAMKEAGEDPDVRLWARWSFFGEKMKALSMMSGQPMPDVNDPNPIQAVAYTWKLDGELMRDRMFFQTTKPMEVKEYANRSIAFTNPATYVYMGLTMAGMEEYTRSMMQAFSSMGVSQAANEALAPKGVKFEDIFTTFGPEIALTSAWEPGGITLPDFFAAVEVKDPVKAHAFAEFIAGNMNTGEGEAVMTTRGDTTIWTATVNVVTFKPTLALSPKHLMFGLNPAAIETAMKQFAEKGPNLATHPGSPYPAALKTVVEPTSMLLYVDAKTLFERLYDKAKPMIAFSLVGSPEVGKHFDSAKLPQAQTISKHLAPMIVSSGATEKGWVIEGTGTVSFMSFYALAIPSAVIGTRVAAPAPPALQSGGTQTRRTQTAPPPAAPAPVTPAPGGTAPGGDAATPATNPPKSVPVPRLLLPVPR